MKQFPQSENSNDDVTSQSDIVRFSGRVHAPQQELTRIPQFSKSQVEFLRVALLNLNSQLGESENLFKTTVEIDYYFEGMFGYKNPIDKRRLAYDQENYVEELTTPIDELLQQLHNIATETLGLHHVDQ